MGRRPSEAPAPGRLTDGPARGLYVKKTAIEPVPGSISRADVADFLVEAAESEAWVQKAVQLGKVKPGDVVCLVAFGAGLTWGSVFLRY